MTTTTVHRLFVHLADTEWGGEIMRRAAEQAAAHHHQRPLIVHVNEHAGWFLSYLFGANNIPDGTICGSANDHAELGPDVREFFRTHRDVTHIGSIRRAA